MGAGVLSVPTCHMGEGVAGWGENCMGAGVLNVSTCQLGEGGRGGVRTV